MTLNGLRALSGPVSKALTGPVRPLRKIARMMHRRAPVGAPPGTLIPSETASETRMSMICYGPNGEQYFDNCSLEDVQKQKHNWPVVWVDVQGLANLDLVKGIAQEFNLHLLSIEDVINVNQRPKAEEFADHVYVVLRLPPTPGHNAGEQISVFTGPAYLVSFQEYAGDCFDMVRKRIGDGRRIVSSGPDYLAYALIDACIDAYFPVLEELGERIENMENEVISNPQPGQIGALHEMKRELLLIRRAIWPTREMLNLMVRDESPVITSETRVFLRDVYDHTIQLMDVVETYREIASGLVDVYLSSQSTKMNEVMKFLTLIATIFIPLSFMAGIWGMNFDSNASPWNLPELKLYFGYPAALASMLLVGIGMILYFRRKRWL